MTLITLFGLSSLLVLPFWGLMILVPGWRWTERIIASPLVVVPTALLYALLVLPESGAILAMVLNPDLQTVAAFLATEVGATIAWVHFLAFDLFVGRWAYLDARSRKLSPLLMAPILFATLMMGPIGLLLYFAVRDLRAPAT